MCQLSSVKTEQDIVWHLENGYQLESSPIDGLLLRNVKDNSAVRAAANQNTIKALEERGLITHQRNSGQGQSERFGG
jgi:hypothetical protein